MNQPIRNFTEDVSIFVAMTDYWKTAVVKERPLKARNSEIYSGRRIGRRGTTFLRREIFGTVRVHVLCNAQGLNKILWAAFDVRIEVGRTFKSCLTTEEESRTETWRAFYATDRESKGEREISSSFFFFFSHVRVPQFAIVRESGSDLSRNILCANGYPSSSVRKNNWKFQKIQVSWN